MAVLRAKRVTIAVVLVGIAVTTLGVLGSRAAHMESEEHLLEQRADEAAAVLTSALPTLVTPLAGAAELAEVTDADQASFERLVGPLVGEEGPFASASIWPAQGSTEPIVVLGAEPELSAQPADRIQEVLAQSAASPAVSVTAFLDGPNPALGYSLISSAGAPDYVIYAESPLPEDRRTEPDPDSAFDDLDYSIYLGEEADEDLLLAATGASPVPEPSASTSVPFGDESIHLVLHPRDVLSGELSARLPWAVAVGGLLLTAAFAVLAERLIRRRRRAEDLAEENGRLYAEQRSLALAVQNTLLPAALPHRADLEIASRYVPGVDGIEVGGDWYDVVNVDDDRLLVVVGDVAGRGLHAAGVMAMLRHAIRAFATDGDRADTFFPKLTRLLEREAESTFATVLCVEVDLASRRMAVVNAGHPRALLIGDDGTHFVETPVGPPVGVPAVRPYEVVEMELPRSGTLLAFTDGLFERRGESVDDGMERLRSSVVGNQPLDRLLTDLLAVLTEGSGQDDIAVVGLRWSAPDRAGRPPQKMAST